MKRRSDEMGQGRLSALVFFVVVHLAISPLALFLSMDGSS